MFDIAPTELMLCALVALVVIGPKDLPKAMRVVGQWVGRARGIARQFRAGFDTMVREAELEEMEKKWREENERIMREHSADSPRLKQIDHAASTSDDAARDEAARFDPGAVEAGPVEGAHDETTRSVPAAAATTVEPLPPEYVPEPSIRPNLEKPSA